MSENNWVERKMVMRRGELEGYWEMKVEVKGEVVKMVGKVVKGFWSEKLEKRENVWERGDRLLGE